tara:strand:- start:12705 stop:13070 length:366 start_codon:yes stop_codon:yes gene_type:complete
MVSILIIDIGVIINKNITIASTGYRILYFSFFNLKNKIIIIGNSNTNASYLARHASPIKINELIMYFLFLLKNRAKDEITKKRNIGSVMPETEFNIILGSKISITGAIKAMVFGKNLLAKK